MSDRPRILFTGYAPVHFLCFKPIYDRIAWRDDVDVFVSGGVRHKINDLVHYDAEGLYAPLGIEAEHILPVQQIEQERFDFLFCANTKRIQPRAVTHHVQLFHGLSFRNRGIRTVKGAAPDYWCVVGPYMLRAMQFRRLVELGDPRALPIGMPKTDLLVNGSLDQAVVRAGFGFDGSRPVALYAPTGARGNSLGTMGEEFILKLGRTGEVDLLIKLHDHSHDGVNWFERLATYEDQHTRLVRDPDVIPAMVAADLLISDASSVTNEFSLLDRPMVFLDVPELLLAELTKGGLLDLETWGRRGGLLAENAESALAAVSESLADPGRHGPVRQKMARDLFFNPGRASDVLLHWLLDKAGLAEAAMAERASAGATVER